MKYDKPIMRMSELVKMGFPRSFLDEAYRERGQDFAQKGPKSNSPVFFDTERFEKWRLRKLANENQSMQRGGFMMGCGLLVCGLDLMPFWFMGTCVAAGLALIAQERDGWK